MDTPTNAPAPLYQPQPIVPPSGPAPIQSPAPTPKAHGMKKGVIAGVVVAGVLVAGYLAYAYLSDSGPFAPSGEPLTSESPNPSMTPDPTVVKIFTSDALGIRFSYLATEGDPIIEAGDKVYVGGSEGQWVQEFAKDPKDDITTAITKKFLAGIPPGKCPVRVQAVEGRPGVEIAQIEFDFEPTGLDDPRMADSPCPEDYRVTNGIRYFWMDAAHPGTFFFFSIGQYAILAEPDRPGDGELVWQDTFEVIK